MRVKITFTPLESFSWTELNQNLLVGFVWSFIRKTEYSVLHDQKTFKFFTFSEIFPFGDFNKGESKNIIISSPDNRFIGKIAEAAEGERVRIGTHPVEIADVKTFSLKPRKHLESGSPIVLRVDGNAYWRSDKSTLGEFINRLTENSLKKYRIFSGDMTFTLDIPLFEGYEYLKSVAHSFWKRNGSRVLIIGSKWRFTLPFGWKKYKQFYSFLLDCGLGEKNSMGYGFVNPTRGGEKG